MFSKAEGFKNDETQQQRSYAQEQGVNPSTQQNAGFEPTPHGSPHPTQNSGCQQVTHVVEQGASPHQATADPFQTRPEPLSPDMQAAAVALAFGQGSQVAVGQHAEGAARTAGPSQPVGSMATSNATTAQAAHEKASIEYVIEPFNYQGVSQSAAAPQPHAQTPQQGQPPLFGAPPPAYYPTAPYGYAPTGHAPMPYQQHWGPPPPAAPIVNRQTTYHTPFSTIKVTHVTYPSYPAPYPQAYPYPQPPPNQQAPYPYPYPAPYPPPPAGYAYPPPPHPQ